MYVYVCIYIYIYIYMYIYGSRPRPLYVITRRVTPICHSSRLLYITYCTHIYVYIYIYIYIYMYMYMYMYIYIYIYIYIFSGRCAAPGRALGREARRGGITIVLGSLLMFITIVYIYIYIHIHFYTSSADKKQYLYSLL